MRNDLLASLSVTESGLIRALGFVRVVSGLFGLTALVKGAADAIQVSPGELRTKLLILNFGTFAVIYEVCNVDLIYRRPFFPYNSAGALYMGPVSARSRQPTDVTNVSVIHPAGWEGLCLMGQKNMLPGRFSELPLEASDPWLGIDEILSSTARSSDPIPIFVKPEVVENWLAFYNRDATYSLDAAPEKVDDSVAIADELLDASKFSGSRKVNQLASQLGTSRRSLQKKTLKAFGVPPKQLLRTQALSQFASKLNLLLYGRKRIGDLAFECGFESFAQFTADYRKQFGERPSDTVRKLEALHYAVPKLSLFG